MPRGNSARKVLEEGLVRGFGVNVWYYGFSDQLWFQRPKWSTQNSALTLFTIFSINISTSHDFYILATFRFSLFFVRSVLSTRLKCVQGGRTPSRPALRLFMTNGISTPGLHSRNRVATRSIEQPTLSYKEDKGIGRTMDADSDDCEQRVKKVRKHS